MTENIGLIFVDFCIAAREKNTTTITINLSEVNRDLCSKSFLYIMIYYYIFIQLFIVAFTILKTKLPYNLYTFQHFHLQQFRLINGYIRLFFKTKFIRVNIVLVYTHMTPCHYKTLYANTTHPHPRLYYIRSYIVISIKSFGLFILFLFFPHNIWNRSDPGKSRTL